MTLHIVQGFVARQLAVNTNLDLTLIVEHSKLKTQYLLNLNVPLDGMPVGRLQVMLSYSDTPDAPVAPSTLKKRSILKRFSSNSNL